MIPVLASCFHVQFLVAEVSLCNSPLLPESVPQKQSCLKERGKNYVNELGYLSEDDMKVQAQNNWTRDFVCYNLFANFHFKHATT